MLSATVIRRLEALENISQQGKRINGLFRLMEDQTVWHEAYARISSNKGAMTPGIDAVTLDGFSYERVASIIAQLKDGTYRFQPVRRVMIPKKNGKKRPLGISSGDDKLVQEVVRNILERIYEPVFIDTSHGFRPGRSPHTALKNIERKWTAVKWIVDMDIRDYFNTINHDLLMTLLKKKIDDTRFLRTIQAMLDAGYLENWQYHKTYSGVPQGSIVSPILANVYLHELDLFIADLKKKFETGQRRKPNMRYVRYTQEIAKLRARWDELKGQEGSEEALQRIEDEIREKDHLRKQMSSGEPFDAGYKRLFYCRYADDFCIGIIGTHADAEIVRGEVRSFLEGCLKLAIAEEKSHIRHGKEGTLFLGYEMKNYSAEHLTKMKRGTRYTTVRTISERLQLHIPKGRLQKFCDEKGYGNYETVKSTHKSQWLRLSDAEIILAYNAEMRGLANYYALACNAKIEMHKLAHIWMGSLLKTLADKHKSSVMKIANRLRTQDGYALVVPGKEEPRSLKVFRLKDLKIPNANDTRLDTPPNIYMWTMNRSELIKRINRNQCEYCGTTTGPFEVHHIRKLKDIAKGKALWQQLMAARHRKTMVLCYTCHHQLHLGTLPGRTNLKVHVSGEPDALKGARPVLRGGAE